MNSSDDSNSTSSDSDSEKINIKKRRQPDLDLIESIAKSAISDLIDKTISGDDISDYLDILPTTVSKHTSENDQPKRTFFALENTNDTTDPSNTNDPDDTNVVTPPPRPPLRIPTIPPSRKRKRESNPAIKELKELKDEIRSESTIDHDPELAIVSSNMSREFKKNALKLLLKTGTENMRSNNPSNDYQRIIKFISDLLAIPWGIYSEPPIHLQKGNGNILAVKEYISTQVNILNKKIYGMTTVKQELVEYLVDKISNPNPEGDVVGLVGDPGVGKTMIAKFIASFLSTKLYTINLGGQKDSLILKGHGRLYVDSTYGEISRAFISTNIMNPCIRIDEPDKISETHCKDIFGALIHAFDPETNKEWLDDYFAGFPIDISRATWIVSYNDPEIINKSLPIGSRMRIINIPGYSISDKIRIAKDYILPSLLKKSHIAEKDVIISDDCIKYMINTFTDPEPGVRNTKEIMKALVRKLQLLSVIGGETNKDHDDILKSVLKFDHTRKFHFPLKITKNILDDLFKDYKTDNTSGLSENTRSMYI